MKKGIRRVGYIIMATIAMAALGLTSAETASAAPTTHATSTTTSNVARHSLTARHIRWCETHPRKLPHVTRHQRRRWLRINHRTHKFGRSKARLIVACHGEKYIPPKSVFVQTKHPFKCVRNCPGGGGTKSMGAAAKATPTCDTSKTYKVIANAWTGMTDFVFTSRIHECYVWHCNSGSCTPYIVNHSSVGQLQQMSTHDVPNPVAGVFWHWADWDSTGNYCIPNGKDYPGGQFECDVQGRYYEQVAFPFWTQTVSSGYPYVKYVINDDGSGTIWTGYYT